MDHVYAKDQVFINIQQQYINFENHIYAVKDRFDLCLFHLLKNSKNELEPMIHLMTIKNMIIVLEYPRRYLLLGYRPLFL